MRRPEITDESRLTVWKLVKIRLPWLILGVIGGAVISFFVAEFREVLEKDISLAFFVPIIVYMSDAVGTQTETIYIRALTKGKIKFWRYLGKEFLSGAIIGLLLGIAIALIASYWLGDTRVAGTVGLAMWLNVALAPLVAILVSETIYKLHDDPALGAGPFATVLQDFISLFIYFSVAVLIIGR